MAKKGIDFNFGEVNFSPEKFQKEFLQSLHKSVDIIGKNIASKWAQQILQTKGIWSVEAQQYAKSISWKMTGDFQGVVSSDYKYAHEIENGRPARDLKKMLGTSLKVRRRKGGQRFLVIPIQHKLKNMPPQLQAQAQALTPSTITGQTLRRAGEIVGARNQRLPAAVQNKSPFLSNPKTRGPAAVTQNKYAWGNHILAGFFGPNGVDPRTGRRRSDIAAGMVRMDTSSGKAKSSKYLTFRVMQENQAGWVIPPQAGKHIIDGIIAAETPKANEFMRKSLQLDIKKMGQK